MTLKNNKILYAQWKKTLETGQKDGRPLKQVWLNNVKKSMEDMAAKHPEVLEEIKEESVATPKETKSKKRK